MHMQIVCLATPDIDLLNGVQATSSSSYFDYGTLNPPRCQMASVQGILSTAIMDSLATREML